MAILMQGAWTAVRIGGLFAVPVNLDPRLDPDPEESLGIGYVLGAAQALGHEVRLFTPLDGSVRRLGDLISNYRPDVLAISLFTCSVPDSLRIASEVRKSHPSVKVVMGGPHATSSPDVALHAQVDYVVHGEGEQTFCELLETLEMGKDPALVKGLCFENSGRLVSTGKRPRIGDLGALPYPVYERRYYDLPARSLSFPPASSVTYAPMIFSRGCKMNCSFCSSREIWGSEVVSRSPRTVASEIQYLQSTYGVNFVFFEDLTFAGAREAMRSLCRFLDENIHKVYWGCETRVDSVSRDDLALMKAAGCTKIIWGIESLDTATLRKTHKGQTSGKIRRTLASASELGILNWGTYMIGFPWETEKSILSAASNLQNLDIHQLRISIATPFPGSKWYKELAVSSLNPDLTLYDTNHLVYDHPSISAARMKELQNELFVRFYGSAKYRSKVARMIRKFQYLRESFDEWMAYVDKNIELLSNGIGDLTETVGIQDRTGQYGFSEEIESPKPEELSICAGT